MIAGLDPDYSLPVQAWWAQHPLNPASASYVARLPAPTTVIDVRRDYGGSIAAALAAHPEPVTLYCRTGVYERFEIVGRGNVHIIGDGPDNTILRGMDLWGSERSRHYATFTRDVSLLEPGAVAVFLNPPGGFVFSDLSFDDGGQYVLNQYLAACWGVRDVLFERCTFRNLGYLAGSWHPGYIIAHHGARNVWARQCRFIGPYVYAFYGDGLRGGGMVDCTIEGWFLSGGVLLLTNDDFTTDFDRDGVYCRDEQRTSMYCVFDRVVNTANSKKAFSITGASNLIIACEATNAGMVFCELFGRYSQHTQGAAVYEHLDNVLDGNRWAWGQKFVVADQCAWQGPGVRVGRTTITNNVLGAMPIVTFYERIGAVEGPDTIWGNTAAGQPL